MSVDLVNNKKEYFGVSNWGWLRLLMLAEKYGWDPIGTRPPGWWQGKKPWNCMNYSSNDGQTVTDQDVKGLAKAIEKAIADLEPFRPEGNAGERKPYLKELQERTKMLENASLTESPTTSQLGIDLDYKQWFE